MYVFIVLIPQYDCWVGEIDEVVPPTKRSLDGIPVSWPLLARLALCQAGHHNGTDRLWIS